jgi:hypothetical protein
MSTPGETPEPGRQDGNQSPWQAPQPPQAPRYGQNPPQAGPQYGGEPPAHSGQPQPGQPQYGQNPYGQPQYGQNPYGQQNPPSPYAYPSGQNYGRYPGAPGAGPGKPPRPREVTMAFGLILGAAVVFLLDIFKTAANPLADMPPEMGEQLRAEGMNPAELAGMLSGVIVVFGILFAGLYLLIALMIRKGKNWARITGTVLAALSLLQLANGPLAVVYVLLGAAGIVLCYLKPSNEYFRPHTMGQGGFGGPGGYPGNY